VSHAFLEEVAFRGLVMHSLVRAWSSAGRGNANASDADSRRLRRASDAPNRPNAAPDNRPQVLCQPVIG
jgi:hypothetical protein